jgi:hypothetical protein
MDSAIHYNEPVLAGYATSVAMTTISETTLVTITDQNFLRKSSFTVMIGATFGAATEIDIRYYCSPNYGTTWYAVPYKSGNQLQNSGLAMNTIGTSISDNVAIPACSAFKVTGKSITQSGMVDTIYILARDN